MTTMTPLGRVQRAWRLGVLGVLVAAFAAGSLVGDDHWWPFAPFRMYSTSTRPSGAVTVAVLQVTTAETPAWTDVRLNPARTGVSRAELEGRQPDIEADPSMLGTLAETQRRLRPDEPAWTAVRYVRRSTVIEDRAPTGEVRERVVAQWSP